jgi:hypothetical protein
MDTPPNIRPAQCLMFISSRIGGADAATVPDQYANALALNYIHLVINRYSCILIIKSKNIFPYVTSCNLRVTRKCMVVTYVTL